MFTITSLKTKTAFIAVFAFALGMAALPANAGDMSRYDGELNSSVAVVDAINQDYPSSRGPSVSVPYTDPYRTLEGTELLDAVNRMSASSRGAYSQAPSAPVVTPYVQASPVVIDPYRTLESVELVDAVNRSAASGYNS